MKKIIYSAMAAALVVTACQKNLKDGSDLSMNEPSSPAQVSISLRSNATKATEAGTDAENKVNRVDAFVFNHDGTLDGYAKVDSPAHIKDDGENPTSIVVKATTGAGKRFVVIVNAAGSGDAKFTDDQMENVAKLSDLEAAARTFYLRNNKRDGFQMYGYKEADLSSGKNPVSIDMNRAVSRVKIDKITRNFSIPSLAGQTMTIEKIYISNVVGSVSNTDGSHEYFNTIESELTDTWFNKYAYLEGHSPYNGYIDIVSDEETNVKSLTYKEIGSVIANGSSDDTGYSFYVMPNDVKPAYTQKDDTDAKCLAKEQDMQSPNPWAPELTKLVIETKLADKTYYYAIPLVKRKSLDERKPSYPEGKIIGGIGSNETFNFSEIVLTRPGSEDPDTPVSIAEVDFQLQIQDWTIVPMATGDNGKYEI